jgi:hypothetical protein
METAHGDSWCELVAIYYKKISAVANTAFPPQKTVVIQYNITSGLHVYRAITNYLGNKKLVYFRNGHKHEHETASKQHGN